MTEDQMARGVSEICVAILELLEESGGDPPVFQAVDSRAHQRGVARPVEAVTRARMLGCVSFDGVPINATKLMVTVAGYYRVRDRDALLHHFFLRVIRALVDRWDREKMLTPTEAQPVVAFAAEIQPLLDLGPREVRMIGHLLDVEPIGHVVWFEDPSVPWSIEIDFWIRSFANIASIEDYLRERHEIL